MKFRARLLVSAGAMAAVVAASAALAIAAGTVTIEDVDVSGHPNVRIEVTAPAAVDPDEAESSFTVTEDGERRSVSVTQLASEDIEIVLLVDTSGSMQGEPIEAARRAAEAFLDRLPAEVDVAVVSFGSGASVLAPFSTDRTATKVAIAGLAAAGRTALYDGVTTALAQFSPEDATARRSIVLLSDGGDTASATTLDDAAGALEASGARLYAIELRTPETDPEPLARLAEVSEGRVVPVDDANGLDAVYTSIASELVSRFELTYRSEADGASTVRVDFAADGVRASGEQRITLPAAAPAPSKSQPAPRPPGELIAVSSLWTNPFVLGAGGLAVFAGLLILTYVVVAAREPRRRLAAEAGVARVPRTTSFAGLAGQASMLAERQLERRGRTGALNDALERAGLDLRPGEYVVLTACAATTAFGVGLMMANLAVGVLFAALSVVAARTLLSVLAARRQARFADQLGDVLQLLAGSLRAGYGLMQAIDAVGREADAPAAEEFGRVIIEARLGRDVSQSLRALADRVASEDFAWVVQAIEIHREVGGDLAEVLDTVAATIRERNQIRRQVKALSAEGRYSAYVLLALPFVVAGLITMTSPGYLSELTRTVPGIVMLGVAGVFMAVGALWLRKLTRLVF
ncbi:MAG: type II secretion system F family protein [Actinomycetota bacterium]|nr:type II secretion system F family protein [Actinomycetota bacterium]